MPLAFCSCVWCAVAFHPGRPERYTAPTRVASVIWDRWPWLDNPLAEIFAERLSGGEPGLLPVATPGCTKALLIGGQWPAPCYPHTIPAYCASPEGLCYANRRKGGYAYLPVARPLGYMFGRQREWA